MVCWQQHMEVRFLPLHSPALSRVTEAELLTGLRASRDDCYSQIFREHYPSLVLTAGRILGERALGEEIAQDVLLELWKRREKLALTGPLRAYLQQATRNRSLNRLRSDRTAQRGEINVRGPSGSPPADARVVAGELERAARDAIAGLSVPQREVFELNRVNGLTYGEIADQLGISVKSVEARMGRALKQLRDALTPWMPESGW